MTKDKKPPPKKPKKLSPLEVRRKMKKLRKQAKNKDWP